MDVLIPKVFDPQTLPQLLSELDLSIDLDHVAIDFSRLRFSSPTAMLVAGSKLREWHTYRKECGYTSYHKGIDSKIPAHSYLMHIGFFDFIHINEGKNIGQAQGNGRYLPLTRVIRPNIDIRKDGLQKWYEVIQNESRRLAVIVAGTGEDCEQLRTFQYCIREIIRNVFEHANVDECYIFGQRWQNGAVEIAILDEGVGLAATLIEYNDQDFYFDVDREALREAIRPGISRTNKKSQAENIYDNSGFGLFVLTQLAASFGWFVLGSGSAQMTGHGSSRTISDLSLPGTFVGIRLTQFPHSFTSVLSDIISEGEYEALQAGIGVRASGMSKLG